MEHIVANNSQHYGASELLNIVRMSSEKDFVRDSLNQLVAAGQMRFHDEKFLANLRRSFSVNLPLEATPQTLVDAVFGEGQFQSWYEENSRSYEEKSRHFSTVAEALENDSQKPDGVSSALFVLLNRAVRGEFVDPQEYHGLLEFAFQLKKIRPAQRMFFLVSGIASGILDLEVFPRIAGKHLSDSPWLEYFLDKSSAKKFQGGDGNRTDFAYNRREIRDLGLWLIQDPDHSSDKNFASRRVAEFMNNEVLKHPTVQKIAGEKSKSTGLVSRIRSGIRNIFGS